MTFAQETVAHRSWTMAQVKSKNTTPEVVVRRVAHHLGYRFRLHRKTLPGVPDLVFPARNAVIFVHGCFWHGHHCPRGARMPSSNVEYWTRKIGRNVARDRSSMRRLRATGWRVMVIWECKTKDRQLISKRLSRFLGPPSVSHVEPLSSRTSVSVMCLSG